jgi:hypothetical protein
MRTFLCIFPTKKNKNPFEKFIMNFFFQPKKKKKKKLIPSKAIIIIIYFTLFYIIIYIYIYIYKSYFWVWTGHDITLGSSKAHMGKQNGVR